MTTVLVVGDLILDTFVYGDVTRISPEAPTPILSVTHKENAPGGAANVARNVAALEADCILVGAIGCDDAGHALTRILRDTARVEPCLIVEATRRTAHKERFVCEPYSSHLLRVDYESIAAVSEHKTIAAIEAAIDRVDCIVLSDYDKGALTRPVIKRVIEMAGSRPVIVDPKKSLYNYRGATLVKPNLKELGVLSLNESEIAMHAAALCLDAPFQFMLITRGENGMSLYNAAGAILHQPAGRVRVRDVSGAGDTVIAVLAVELGRGSNIVNAVSLASKAAAIAVSKSGTATASYDEILHSRSRYICFPDARLERYVNEWRAQGLKIGFTNGCFDLIHPGHISLIGAAARQCDRLIIGINDDEYVRRHKGEGRPIQDQRSRAEVLMGLDGVSLVVAFEDESPERLLAIVRPDVYIMGDDHKKEDPGAQYAAQVQLIPRVPDQSTTRLVAAMGNGR